MFDKSKYPLTHDTLLTKMHEQLETAKEIALKNLERS